MRPDILMSVVIECGFCTVLWMVSALVTTLLFAIANSTLKSLDEGRQSHWIAILVLHAVIGGVLSCFATSFELDDFQTVLSFTRQLYYGYLLAFPFLAIPLIFSGPLALAKLKELLREKVYYFFAIYAIGLSASMAISLIPSLSQNVVFKHDMVKSDNSVSNIWVTAVVIFIAVLLLVLSTLLSHLLHRSYFNRPTRISNVSRRWSQQYLQIAIVPIIVSLTLFVFHGYNVLALTSGMSTIVNLGFLYCIIPWLEVQSTNEGSVADINN